MANTPTHLLTRFLHRIAVTSGSIDLPDHQLLLRFAARRDETAFAALVRRHGPLVLSTHTVQLAEGVLKAMFLTKVKVATTVLLAMSVLVAGAGLFTHSLLAVEERAGQQQDAVRAATDQDKLQGTWQLVSQESGGQVEQAENTKLVIEGDKLRLTSNDKVEEVSIRLNAMNKPKESDVIGSQNGQEIVHRGIYELQGESWKVCMARPNEARPAEFASQAGAKWPKVFVLKKQK